jgi:hypothetical protein
MKADRRSRRKEMDEIKKELERTNSQVKERED